MELEGKRDEIIRIAAKYGAGNLRIFGSVARGDARATSDMDLLVELDPDRSFLDLVGLGQDLEELLQRKVDVLTDASLHPALHPTDSRRRTPAVKDERFYLGHIRDAIPDIEEYSAVGRDLFMADRMRQDAVLRKFEIIGEAVKHLADTTKQRQPGIPRHFRFGRRRSAASYNSETPLGSTFLRRLGRAS